MGSSSRQTIVHIAREPVTGVWTVMKELASWQMSEGHDVKFVLLVTRTWPYRTEVQSSGFSHTLLPSPDIPGTAAFLYHDLLKNLLGVVRHIPPGALIHHHNAWMAASLMNPKDPGGRQVVTFHGIPGGDYLQDKPVRLSLHRRWARQIVASQAILVSVDPRGPTLASASFGIAPERFVVVPNGIADREVRGCPHLGNPGVFTIVHVGLVNEGKGWRILFEAAEQARARGLLVRVLIAGSGPAEEVRAANEWCMRFGSGSRHLGFVRDTTSVFAQADALVLASNHHEGMPMSIIEALSAGVPVIATRVGGIPYMIEDGVHGYLVDRSSDAICDRIHRLATDGKIHVDMSRAARRQYLEQFSASKMGRAYERVYDMAQVPHAIAEV